MATMKAGWRATPAGSPPAGPAGGGGSAGKGMRDRPSSDSSATPTNAA
jgi:hypothetical protein